MAFPVVRVCVTIVSLLQSNFLCTRVSSYGCNLCVLNITCGQIFTVLRYLGHLGLFIVFFSEELEVFWCRLTLLPDSHVSACSSVAFQVFQYAYYASYAQQPVGGLASGSFYVSSSVFWGFSGHFSSCFRPLNFVFKQDCSLCGPRASSIHPIFRCCVSCREPHCSFSSMAIPRFQSCFLALFSALFVALPWMLPARFPQLQVC